MNDCDQLQQCLILVKEEEKRSWESLLNGSNGAAEKPPTKSLSVTNMIEKPSFLDALITSEANSLSLHPNLALELTQLREAHNRLWSALEENAAVINEFESLSTDSSPNV